MRTVMISFLALAVFAGSAGCAADAEETAASEGELRALTIGDADSGKTFTVEKGQTFKVSLASNASTGYSWSVVSTSRSLGYPTPREGTYQGPGAGGPIGGGGRQLFTWKTDRPNLQPGTTAHAVKLEYRRSWEDASVPAAKTFTFKVKIKAGAEPEPEPTPAQPVVLFEEHNNETITAAEGRDVVIRLPENPTAGYRWRVVRDGALDAPEKDYESNNPGAVGAGGTAIFTYKTDGKVGSYSVSLKYSRGEQGTAAKTFKFKLNVVAAEAEEQLECPTIRVINCMPPTTSPYCAGEYRSWAQENCDVSYLD